MTHFTDLTSSTTGSSLTCSISAGSVKENHSQRGQFPRSFAMHCDSYAKCRFSSTAVFMAANCAV